MSAELPGKTTVTYNKDGLRMVMDSPGLITMAVREADQNILRGTLCQHDSTTEGQDITMVVCGIK